MSAIAGANEVHYLRAPIPYCEDDKADSFRSPYRIIPPNPFSTLYLRMLRRMLHPICEQRSPPLSMVTSGTSWIRHSHPLARTATHASSQRTVSGCPGNTKILPSPWLTSSPKHQRRVYL